MAYLKLSQSSNPIAVSRGDHRFSCLESVIRSVRSDILSTFYILTQQRAFI